MLKQTILPLLALLALSLSACGKLEGDKVDPRRTYQAIKTGAPDPVLNKLAQDCQALNGRLDPNGRICMTRVTMDLPPSTPGQSLTSLDIDPAFVSGKFIVATGNAGAGGAAVDILFAGRPLTKIPARVLGVVPAGQSGRLSFYVNSPNYTGVSVTVWSCFDRVITNRVYCPHTIIP